jgi:hypothetical protein
MAGMRRPQFTLRGLLFFSIAIGIALSAYIAKHRRDAIELRSAATKAYLSTRAFLDEKGAVLEPKSLAATIKVQDDLWKRNYPSWPVPEYPPPK